MDNRRQYTRVPVSRNVHLVFGTKEYTYPLANLSLSGMYVQGDIQQQPGDICTISLTASRSGTEIAVSAVGYVVRVDQDGAALRFSSMSMDSFLFLQTILLYEADDPVLIGAESIKHTAFEKEEYLTASTKKS